MNDDPIVRIEHVREAKLCVTGARHWFKQYGLDFRGFLLNGLPASTLEATGDAFAFQVTAKARKEKDNG